MTTQEIAKRKASIAIRTDIFSAGVRFFTEDGLAKLIEEAISEYHYSEPSETEQRYNGILNDYRRLRAADVAHANRPEIYLELDAKIAADENEGPVGKMLIEGYRKNEGFIHATTDHLHVSKGGRNTEQSPRPETNIVGQGPAKVTHADDIGGRGTEE